MNSGTIKAWKKAVEGAGMYSNDDEPASTPSFCWHCGKKLRLPVYAEWTDQLGSVHRVHKTCLKDMPRSLTAASVGEHGGGGSYHRSGDGKA